MSLVEKALKKLHDQRSAAAAGTTPRVSSDALPDSIAVLPPAPSPRLEAHAAPPPAPVPRKSLTVNMSALRAAGLLAPEEEQRRISSEYRQIKRPLIAAAMGRGSASAVANGRVIVVASALPGEGKTFTSVNLALNMALEKDTSVLLIDADLPKPHIGRVLGVSEEPGLLDVLRDESRDVEADIFSTNIRGLSFLPAGTPNSTATELLASARMESVLADLMRRDPKRILLFDSSPLLLTTESRALAGVAGQVVIVVRAESTNRQAVLDAVGYVPQDKTVGLVLNQCRGAAAHSYYGYGDYYGDAPAE